MFEQPLYEFEPTAAPQLESSLFHDYEVKGWMSSSGLFKVVGISAVANIVALFVFAQTSLLTMKGCDSPLVGTVCQVLDTVYVGALLFGTDREYVDAEYDKIDLGEADITFIDVSKETPPLTYPVGYFELANPEDFAPPAVDDMELAAGDLFKGGISGFPGNIPGITSPSYGGDLTDTPPNIPKANPDVIDEGTLPGNSGNGGAVYWPTPWKPPVSIRKKKPPLSKNTPDENSGFPQPDPNAVAEIQSPSPSPSPTPQPTVEPTDPVTDVELNKRPFVELAATLNGLLDMKAVNLETPFKIKATGKLDKNGKLDRKSFAYTERLSPDPRMIEVVQEAIEAMNNSGFLQYLTMVKAKDVSFEILQDDQRVIAVVQSEFEDPNRANSMSGLLKLFIDQKKKDKEAPDASQNDKDDLALLQSAKVEPVGKKLIVSFAMPKADMQRMIMRMLAEQKAQPKSENTNGVVPKPSADPAQK
ncbi:MAG: hypothetical protein IPL32_12635 [Chloracidobacterium sp.]|nr:hypothetical protein [Chloracidobacterium sp.]